MNPSHTKRNWIIGIAIVVIVLAGAYYYSSNNGFKQADKEALTVDSSQQVPKEIYETYSNKDLGFEVKYSSNMAPNGPEVNDMGTKLVSFEDKVRKFKVFVDPKITEYSPVCNTAAGVDPDADKIINGFAFKNFVADKQASTYESYSSHQYCTVWKDRGYRLVTSLKSYDTPRDVLKDEVLNQMLNSFKFTN